MSKVTGYFLKLSSNRYEVFDERYEEEFAEPVTDFTHSSNVPLICFVITRGSITDIGLAKRGMRAGTNLRRLNISSIYRLENPIKPTTIIKEVNPRFKKYLAEKAKNGGLLTIKSFEEFLDIFIKIVEKEASLLLNKYSKERREKIKHLAHSKLGSSLAQQQEAILTAMNIAGIDREQTLGWDVSADGVVDSYLDGLESVHLREDSQIINDLTTLPGFDAVKNHKHSSTVFKNDKSKLTILLANRLPLEELLGTDLIYYNEDFKCFVMVQYKVMEKEGGDFLFRLPNSQFSDELKRMDDISLLLNGISNEDEILDFRISKDPFFIKMCPRIEFNPDDVGLSTGMYLPLEYLKLLQKDHSTMGPKGGRFISYDNVSRYFNNTSFKTIVEQGWIGTHIKQSEVLEQMITSTIQYGRTAVIAIKESIADKQVPDKSMYDDIMRSYHNKY